MEKAEEILFKHLTDDEAKHIADKRFLYESLIEAINEALYINLNIKKMENYLDEKIKEFEIMHSQKKLSEYGCGMLDAYKDIKDQFFLFDVGNSAWYCEISTINGQWNEIVTGVNETEVAIKIEKTFGKGTKFEIKNKFKLM